MKTARQQHADSRYASAFDLDHSGPAPMHPRDRIVVRGCALAAIALGVVLWTSDAKAQQNDQHRLHVVVHGLSHHFADRTNGQPWNERNGGAGIRYQIDGTFGVQAGAYKNSINATSKYLWGEFTPLHVGTVSAGLFAGAVDGYKANGGGFRPAGGLLARWQPNAFSLTGRYVPKGSIDGSPVVSIEAGWRF